MSKQLICTKEHFRDVASIDWNELDRKSGITSSWDGTIKLVREETKIRVLKIEIFQWDLSRPHNSTKTFNSGSDLVYEARWNQNSQDTFASVDINGRLLGPKFSLTPTLSRTDKHQPQAEFPKYSPRVLNPWLR